MSRFVPYPLLTASLVLMWLLLTRFSLGHLLLGTGVAIIAGQAMQALQPAKPRVRRWDLLLRFVFIVFVDIIRSNIDVARLILTGGRHGERHSGFVEIPLDLRDRMGLSVLAIVITATPGSAWMEYDSTRDRLLIHVFDLVDDAAWVDQVKNRYERLLREIFE